MVAFQDLKSQVMALHGDSPWPGRSVYAERDDRHSRAGSPLPSVTISCAASACGFVLGGWGRVGVSRQCWDQTSHGEALSRWLRMRGGGSESEREVSALPPHPSASVLSRQRLLQLLSWLFPPAGPEPRTCALPSPLLVLSLQWCWDASPSCAGGAVPILTLALPGLPPAGPGLTMCRVHGGGFGTLCREERSPATPGQGY